MVPLLVVPLLVDLPGGLESIPGHASREGHHGILMIAGIALFGVLTANIAAFFVEQDLHEDRDPLMEQLDEVLRRLDRLDDRGIPGGYADPPR